MLCNLTHYLFLLQNDSDSYPTVLYWEGCRLSHIISCAILWHISSLFFFILNKF